MEENDFRYEKLSKYRSNVLNKSIYLIKYKKKWKKTLCTCNPVNDVLSASIKFLSDKM